MLRHQMFTALCLCLCVAYCCTTAAGQNTVKALEEALVDVGLEGYTLMWPVRDGGNDWVGSILRARDRLMPPLALPAECLSGIENLMATKDISPFSGYLHFSDSEKFIGAAGGLLRGSLGLSARDARSKYVILSFTPGKEEFISAEGLRKLVDQGTFSRSCSRWLRKKPIIVSIVRPASFTISVVSSLTTEAQVNFQENSPKTQALLNLYGRNASVKGGALVVETPYCVAYKTWLLKDVGIPLPSEKSPSR